jgi:hypothetical protein
MVTVVVVALPRTTFAAAAPFGAMETATVPPEPPVPVILMAPPADTMDPASVTAPPLTPASAIEPVIVMPPVPADS